MQIRNHLESLGWDSRWQQAYDAFIWASGTPKNHSDTIQMNHCGDIPTGNSAQQMPARILLDHGQRFLVSATDGERWVSRPTPLHMPPEGLAAGDWIIVSQDPYSTDTAHFVACLPRRTKFSRLAPGNKVQEQILAANIDVLFLVQSLNKDFNLRRLQRYLIAAWESGARPVVVLTKSDLCQDPTQLEDKLQQVESVAPGVDIVAVSALQHEGLESLEPFLGQGKTVALLGSSGVGKSTLINTLVGKAMLATQGIREDDSKGRHTTTHRELVPLQGGGILIDTPGMRSFALWESEAGMQQVFGDVEALARDCQFVDCDHQHTSGCAIQQALAAGTLEQGQYINWLKLQKEQRILDNKIRRKERLLDKQQASWRKKKPHRADVIKRAMQEY